MEMLRFQSQYVQLKNRFSSFKKKVLIFQKTYLKVKAGITLSI